MQSFRRLLIVAGDTGDADVSLPCPRVVIAASGTHVVDDDFTIEVSELTSRDAIGMPAWVRAPLRWTIASAALHVGVLALAFFFALRVDPKKEEADRMDRLREYSSRVAQQPRDASAHVESVHVEEELRDDRGGNAGEGAHVEARALAIPIVSKKVARAPSTKPHQASSRGGGSGTRSGASSCAAYAHADHDPKAAWIEFVLDDERGRPVAGEPYRVTLPDGTVRTGVTDERGLVCFTGVKPGNARIEWTRLGDSAQYMGAKNDPI